MVAEDGKERKTEGTNREKRDPWQGSGKESHAGVRICLLLSSAVRWQAPAQSVCLGSLRLAPTPTVPVPPVFHLLGASSLQDPQVIVLFGHSKLEATHRVVEAKGGILGGQRAGKHSHYSVQGSEVRVAAILCRPAVVPPTCTRQPLSILKPLDLGARHGKLGEEFVCLRTGDSFREVRHLQHPSQHNICCTQVSGGRLERLPLASVSVLQSALSLVHRVS